MHTLFYDATIVIHVKIYIILSVHPQTLHRIDGTFYYNYNLRKYIFMQNFEMDNRYINIMIYILCAVTKSGMTY